MNTLFPIYIKQDRLKVLLVGGSKIALEKLNTLLFNSPQANIVVLAKDFSDEIIQLGNHLGNVVFIRDEYDENYLIDFNLIIAGTDNRLLNYRIAEDAKAKNILFNAADMPEYCDFYLGSVVRKGDLKIGISTNGKSPIMAVRIKELLNHVLPDELESIIEELDVLRSGLKADLNTRVKKLKEVTASFSKN